MARILISESHEDVRLLLERMVSRLGHEPNSARMPSAQEFADADVLIVEPASPVGTVLAQAASIARPSLPVICASVAAPPPELAELGVTFTASLVKPFTLDQLAAAIELALLNPHSLRG